MAGTLPGFDADTFRDAIHQVQEFFVPADQRPLFVFPDAPGTEHVPFNPATPVTRTPTKPSITVPCSIEYQDASGRLENLGMVVASTIVITLLDADYSKVQGFWYVVINNTRYYYRSTDIPSALGTVTLWTVRCVTEDEA